MLQVALLQIIPSINFIMRLSEQLINMGKVHNSVQQMLVQARQIVSPPFTTSKHKKNHIEVYLPATKINQHLKQILREPSSNYKKIQRSKRYNSVSLQNYNQRQEREHQNLMTGSSKHASRSLNRYALDSIISNVQNELIDKRNKRFLYEKKMINVLPQLPNIPKSQAQNIKRIYQKINGMTPKYYITNTQNNSIECLNSRYNETQQKSKTKQVKNQQYINKHRFKNKRVKSLYLQNTEQNADKTVKDNKIKLRKIEQKMLDLYEPQPWIQQSKKDEYFDFNNF